MQKAMAQHTEELARGYVNQPNPWGSCRKALESLTSVVPSRSSVNMWVSAMMPQWVARLNERKRKGLIGRTFSRLFLLFSHSSALRKELCFQPLPETSLAAFSCGLSLRSDGRRESAVYRHALRHIF